MFRPVTRLDPDDFTDLFLIGTGGFGKVYKAYDKTHNRDVAIKQIIHNKDEKIKKAVAREVRIHSSLSNENIVEFYGLFETEDTTWLVMEYCENGSLMEIPGVREGKIIPVSRVREYMYGLAKAIKYMHDKSLIHRDIKVTNILLDKNHRAKLCDFGLTMRLSETNPNQPNLCGTVSYIAPEVLNGRNATRSCDVWSFGCTLYRLLVGRMPFGTNDIKQAIGNEEPLSYEIPNSVDRKAAKLIEKCLVTESQQRISIEGVLNDPFFVGSASDSSSPYSEPLTCPFSKGVVSITSDGAILLNYIGSDIIRINPDPNIIDVLDKDDTNIYKSYTKNQLPKKYQKKYQLALKLAKEAQEKYPLVIWYVSDGKYVLYADGSIKLFSRKHNEDDVQESNTLKEAMRNLVKVVQNSPEPQWPIIVGPQKQ